MEDTVLPFISSSLFPDRSLDMQAIQPRKQQQQQQQQQQQHQRQQHHPHNDLKRLSVKCEDKCWKGLFRNALLPLTESKSL